MSTFNVDDYTNYEYQDYEYRPNQGYPIQSYLPNWILRAKLSDQLLIVIHLTFISIR